MTAISSRAGSETGAFCFCCSISAMRASPVAIFAFQTGQDWHGSLRTAPVSRQKVTPVLCQAMGQWHSEHTSAAVNAESALEVGQAGGALAQFVPDRGAFLPAQGRLQGGAQFNPAREKEERQ